MTEKEKKGIDLIKKDYLELWKRYSHFMNIPEDIHDQLIKKIIEETKKDENLPKV